MNAKGYSKIVVLIDGIGLALFALLYLYCFRSMIPSGDGEVYAAQIASGELVWNPNHLLMQPIGFVWANLLSSLGVSIIDSLQLLSALAAALTVFLFNWALAAVVMVPRYLRVLGVIGLFFSRNFLSMALSEEFFIVQLPFSFNIRRK